MRSILLVGLVPVIFGVSACAGKVTPSSESTLSGTAALSTYTSAPSAIVVRDETGRVIKSPIRASGAFSVQLPASHQYKVAVLTATGEIPLVFPRSSGKLDTTFSVRSAGANVVLGGVRHLPHAPPGGFHVMSTPGPAGGDTSGAGGNCEDCADDNQQVSCQDGQSGDQGQSGEEGQSESDGAGGQDDANGDSDLAVADHNAPDNVDGCDNHQAGDDNGDQGGDQSEQ